MAMAKRPSRAIAPSSSSSLTRSRNWSQPSSEPEPETEPGPGRDWDCDWDPKTNRPTTRATRMCVCVCVREIGGGDAARRQSPALPRLPCAPSTAEAALRQQNDLLSFVLQLGSCGCLFSISDSNSRSSCLVALRLVGEASARAFVQIVTCKTCTF